MQKGPCWRATSIQVCHVFWLPLARVLYGFNQCYQASTVHCSKQQPLRLTTRINKNSRERQESNLWLLGAKRERYPLCYVAPQKCVLLNWSLITKTCSPSSRSVNNSDFEGFSSTRSERHQLENQKCFISARQKCSMARILVSSCSRFVPKSLCWHFSR